MWLTSLFLASSWSRRYLFHRQCARLTSLKFCADSRQSQLQTNCRASRVLQARGYTRQLTSAQSRLLLKLKNYCSERYKGKRLPCVVLRHFGCFAILSGRLLILLFQHVCKSKHVSKHHRISLDASCNRSACLTILSRGLRFSLLPLHSTSFLRGSSRQPWVMIQ